MKKAYKNPEFLEGRDARSIRILSEYLEPQSRFRHYKVEDTVVFFGSARIPDGEDAAKALDDARKGGDDAQITRAETTKKLSRYYEDARTIARGLTEWSKSLDPEDKHYIVCSGAGPGIMEAANRGASEARGKSIGLGISLPQEPSSNPYVTRELGFEFHYFFMRKFWFVYLAKALVVFPGGFGTMDELFELLTLLQTQKSTKETPIVLYGEEFWNEIVDFDALVRWGTISPEDLDLFHVSSDPEDALKYLKSELTRLYPID
ncbi:MAG: LOG family protein [Acidobacteriota bacterium]|nr:LOG family protein [Acidobacteriota bacterium]MDH3785307.1 LOG family protein [Acidobacteriota bacterium]